MPEGPLAIIAVIAVGLLALSWHEAAHAWVADRLGDSGPREAGRVSLNPIRHLDPMLSVVLPIVLFMSTGFIAGGGKPVRVNRAAFRKPARDFMLVALAGPASNLLLVVLFSLVYLLCTWAGALADGPPIANPYGADIVYEASLQRAYHAVVVRGDSLPSLLETVLFWGVAINVLLALFNLVPVPPLDGSRVVAWLLPRRVRRLWYALDPFGLILLLIVLLVLGGHRYLYAAILTVFTMWAEFVDGLLPLNPFA